jgi:hypothetical protein
MKILYINSITEDYLADCFLIGLKGLPNVQVLEYPQNFYIYKSEELEQNRGLVRGNGFSLYNLLPHNTPTNPIDIVKNFDLIVFSSIHRQYGIFLQFYPFLNPKNTLICDGEDGAALFPYHGSFLRKPYFWFFPRPHKRFLYFKREWLPEETLHYRYYRLIPKFLCEYLPPPKNVRPMSFSIPDTKVLRGSPVKTKLFPKHIVDDEIVGKIEGSYTSYAFTDETDYYQDLQASKFGITTKRAGWDCLRHYEIAANGAVICFKDLAQKPETCAPHGLIDGFNCLAYTSYSDLKQKIDALTPKKYAQLLDNTKVWIEQNTCEYQAKKILENFI